MNEQQLDAVKQALYGLVMLVNIEKAKPWQVELFDKTVDNLLSIISQEEAQPAPVQSAERGEPVAWMRNDGKRVTTAAYRHNYPDYETRYSIPLYTTPPIVATPLAAQKKRPPNCGTGYCSCIECVVEPVACDGWLQEGSLLYRLTDGRKPQNRDEINVTMADESRSVESRTRRAGELLDRIRATPPIVATPLAAQKPWVGLTDEDKHEIERKEKNT